MAGEVSDNSSRNTLQAEYVLIGYMHGFKIMLGNYHMKPNLEYVPPQFSDNPKYMGIWKTV